MVINTHVYAYTMEMFADGDELMDKVVEGKGNYIILFMADWCPYCARFKPIFELYEKRVDGYKFAIAKVNEDDNPLWDIFNLKAVPTIIAFRNGSIVARKDARLGIGLSEDDMRSLLNELGFRLTNNQ
jgi:thioredoxin 1